MAEPLSLLRQYNVNKKELIDKSTPLGTPKQLKRAAEDILQSIAKKPHLSVCLHQVAAENIPVLRQPDKEDLIANLQCDTAATVSIKTTPFEITTQVKRAAEDTLEAVPKKPRLEETHILKVKVQLASGPNEPKEASVTVDNIKSGKDGAPKEYSSSECLSFLLKNVTLTHPVCVRQAAAENIPVVRQPATQVKRATEDPPESAAKKPRLEKRLVQKVKQQLTAGPNALKEASVAVHNIKSSEAMSVEKTDAIKAKHLAKKRTTVKGNDICLGSDLRVMPDIDVDVTKGIISRERQWRTRTTVLQSAEKTFGKNTFAILQSIEAQEEGRHRPPQPTPIFTPRATPIRSIPEPAV